MNAQYSKLSIGLVAIATATGFFAGAAAVWFLFGADWSYRLEIGGGSRADWVAAFFGGVAAAGTWAIGYGANKYAREAHQQRMSEARARSDADRRAITVRLAAAATRMAAPQILAETIIRLEEKAKETKLLAWEFIDLMDSIEDRGAAVVFEQATLDLLEPKHISEVMKLNVSLRVLRRVWSDSRHIALAMAGDMGSEVGDEADRALERCYTYGPQLKQECAAFSDGVVAIREAL